MKMLVYNPYSKPKCVSIQPWRLVRPARILAPGEDNDRSTHVMFIFNRDRSKVEVTDIHSGPAIRKLDDRLIYSLVYTYLSSRIVIGKE
jgi:hypothetical protein